MSILSYGSQFSTWAVLVPMMLSLLILMRVCGNTIKAQGIRAAVLISLIFSFAPVHAQSDWSGWPSTTETDGRFIAISGPLSAIRYVAPNIIIGIPSNATQFNIELFDGDASVDLSSKYDINVSTAGYTYTLYQDPERDGTGTQVELTRAETDFTNDSWSSYVTDHAVNTSAQGLGGFYWYRLALEFNGNPDEEQFFNALKVRVNSDAASPVSVGALKEIIIGSSPFNPVLDPGLGSPENTYDGDWLFNIRVPEGVTTPLNFSDSDADFDADATDPGLPPDDNFSRPEFMISPSIRYEIFAPNGELITFNTDPSGTYEEETYSYNPQQGVEAGLYQWHWFGVDAANVLVLSTDFEILVDTIVEEPAIDIRKQQEGPDSREFNVGDSIDFEIVVTNTGNVDLTDVVVSDPLTPSCDRVIGALAIGESHTYTCTTVAEVDQGSSQAVTVFFDNFESDLGWIANPSATDTATRGLFVRANPESVNYNGYKQLGTTVSGSTDLVTGPYAGSRAGSYDIDGGVTSIRSPNIDIPTGGSSELSLSYYLAHYSNSTSSDFLKVSVVGSSTSRTILDKRGLAANVDAVWKTLTSDLSDFSGQTVYLLIEAADAGTCSLVEAAIDDIKITHDASVSEGGFVNVATVTGLYIEESVTDTDTSEVIINGEPPVTCEACINGQSQITLSVSNWSSNRDQSETVRVREGGLGGTILFEGQVSNSGSFTFDVTNPGVSIVVTVQGYYHPSEYVKGTFVTDCDLYINKTSGNSYITFKVTDLVSDGEEGTCPGPVVPPPSSVVTTTITNAYAGNCLDNLGSDAHSSVYKRRCSGGQNQQWALRAQGNYYEIVNADSKLCLDVYNSSGSSNAKIDQWTCGQTANQLWEIKSYGGEFLIKSKSSGKCLEVTSTSGAYQYTCDGYVGQRWNLSKP